MGQKVNPNGFRYGVTKNHNALWYANKKEFAKYLLEDQKIYKYVNKFVRQYQIGKTEIQRNQDGQITLIIHTARVGVFVGERGSNLKNFETKLKKFTRNHNIKLNIKVVIIDKPELNARLLAEAIAIKLENRVPYRVAQKMIIRTALRSRTKGIKTQVAGRLNGVEMARTEGYNFGVMSLHTLRQNIEYAQTIAKTTYGSIGVKVWISHGEILTKKG